MTVNVKLSLILAVAATSFVLIANFILFAMIGEINRRLSDGHPHHGTRPSSLKYPPVGPSAAIVAISIATRAPCSGVRGPL
jgi:hypothetical protein